MARASSNPRPHLFLPFSAEDTPLTALALAWLWEQAGGPKGVVNVVPTPRELVQEVGNVLTTDEAVRKISFTGSTAVGKQLLRQAASTVKKTSMELGGNAPFVVSKQRCVFRAFAGFIMRSQFLRGRFALRFCIGETPVCWRLPRARTSRQPPYCSPTCFNIIGANFSRRSCPPDFYRAGGLQKNPNGVRAAYCQRSRYNGLHMYVSHKQTPRHPIHG